MAQHDISAPFERAPVFFPGLEIRAAKRDWYPAPAWDRVYLKDLVTAKETGGAFSDHLVRVRPQCEVADHDHEVKWKWNVVLAGTGSFLIGEGESRSRPARRSSYLRGATTPSAPATRSSPSSRSSSRRSRRDFRRAGNPLSPSHANRGPADAMIDGATSRPGGPDRGMAPGGAGESESKVGIPHPRAGIRPAGLVSGAGAVARSTRTETTAASSGSSNA